MKRGSARRLQDVAMSVLFVLATAVALVPLFSILWWVARQGLPAWNLEFFTALPKPVGEPGGGVAHALLGTLMLVAMACLVGIPTGILAGIYLAEYGRSRIAHGVRFLLEVATGIPSIVTGIFIYTVVVTAMGHFSAVAGSLALAFIMVPVVARTTEEMLRLVPDHLREAALALGVPRWKAILRIVLPTARAGILTGVMLAVARVAGEAAPLLFTSPGSPFWPTSVLEPVASLPVQIYLLAIQPYPHAHTQAWGAALLLITLVLVLNVAARVLARRPGGRL